MIFYIKLLLDKNINNIWDTRYNFGIRIRIGKDQSSVTKADHLENWPPRLVSIVNAA